MPNVQGLLANDHKDLMNKVRQFITGYGTFPAPGFAGVGDGPISDVASPPPSLSETWTITCNLGGGTGVATFTVVGSVSGAQADATVGEFYETVGKLFEFLIKDGPIDFVIADVFTVVITEGAMITVAQEWGQNRWIPHPNDLTGTNFDVPRNAFNANQGVPAVRTSQTTAIAQAQFDDAVEFDQYTIVAQGNLFVLANTPQDWTFEWSDDLTGPWTTVDTQVGVTAWIAAEFKNFPLTSPGRHFNWRWVITNNNGGVDVDVGFFEARVTGDLISALDEGQLLLTGQGLAGTDTIFVGMAILENPLTPFFNWRLDGAIAFDDNEPFQNQPARSESTFFVIDTNTVEYWIVATGRYFIVVCKIGTVYTSMMMGFHLPYGVPAEYGYPLVIAGSIGTGTLHFTNLGSHFRMFANPGASAMRVRDPGGSWLTFENFFSANPGNSQANIRNVKPYAGKDDNVSAIFMAEVTQAIDGSYPLTPCVLGEWETDAGQVGLAANAYGELDGVFHVSGSLNTPENSTVIDGDTYIFFPDIFRNQFNNFMAIRMDT